jgi:hypothetical protein
MLNTSIKVIATQYTDDHGWSQIREKKSTVQRCRILISMISPKYKYNLMI